MDNDLIQKAILNRHAVRRYAKKKLDENIVLMLQNEIEAIK